jgi:hypothetical protein
MIAVRSGLLCVYFSALPQQVVAGDDTQALLQTYAGDVDSLIVAPAVPADVGNAGPWQCHHYAASEHDSWCRTVGVREGYQFEYGVGSDKCGGCFCCKRTVSQAMAQLLKSSNGSMPESIDVAIEDSIVGALVKKSQEDLDDDDLTQLLAEVREVKKSINKAKDTVADVTSKSTQFPATEVTGSLQPLLKPLADQTWRVSRHRGERSEVPLSADEMISEVAGEVDGFVKEAFRDIEAQIAAMQEQVVDLATKVSVLKPTADKKDSELYACRKQEKALLVADNDVEAAMAALNAEKDSVCKQRDMAKYFNWTVRNDLNRAGVCDFKGKNGCGYRMVSGNVQNLSVEYRKARENYFKLQEECTVALTTLERQLDEDAVTVGSTSAFQRKKESCDVTETMASTAMCTFGNRLQEKCYAVSQLQELIAMTGPGSALQSLYLAAQELKCGLDTMKARNDGFTDFVNPCVSHPPDFARDVGLFKDY